MTVAACFRRISWSYRVTLWKEQKNSTCQLPESGVWDYCSAASLPATHTSHFQNRQPSILRATASVTTPLREGWGNLVRNSVIQDCYYTCTQMTWSEGCTDIPWFIFWMHRLSFNTCSNVVCMHCHRLRRNPKKRKSNSWPLTDTCGEEGRAL